MRVSALFFVLVTLISGCVASRMIQAPSFTLLPPAEQSLWRMRLGEDETGFTALLGLRLHDGILDMVVLDPTGYKLFEGSVDRFGKLRVMHVMPLVQERGLPEYLAESCQRIFFYEPGYLPCEGGWFNNLCIQNEAGTSRKIARRATFAVWEVAYYRQKDNAELSRIVMRWMWFKPTLTLELM